MLPSASLMAMLAKWRIFARQTAENRCFTPAYLPSTPCGVTGAHNSRTEALNLIRNRKGHLPHIVVVTAEPMPNRLASLALGTGDIDCVYHFALYELIRAVKEVGSEDAAETLETLVQGKRFERYFRSPAGFSCIMADTISSDRRSKIMSHIKSKDTSIEMMVRRRLFAMGYRYRVNYKALPGKPDIVFTKKKIAIFIHGCYWHGHDCGSRYAPYESVKQNILGP